MPSEELYLPFPAPSRDLVPIASHVKGSWLASSTRSIRQAGYQEAYLRLLPAAYHEVILHTAMSVWHPLDVLEAHYEACEGLNLTTAQIIAVGQEATQHAQGSVIGLSARLAASTVVTPWTILGQFQRFWDRFLRGGGVAVYKLGPKEARLELVQFPGCRYRYCAVATRGVVQNALGLFCTRAYVSELPAYASSTELAMRIAWA